MRYIPRRELVAIFAEAALVCAVLTACVFLAQWNYDFSPADEGFQWYISQRVRFGDMPIRESFSYDPGRYFWSAAWFQVLGGDGLFEQRFANTCLGLLGLASVYAAMAAAGVRRSIRLASAALLAFCMGFPLHKISEQAVSLIGVSGVAFTLFQPRQRFRWILLGTLTGIAAIFGRNLGLYIGLGSLLACMAVWKLLGRRTARDAFLAYSIGVFAGYLPMLLWFFIDERFRQAMVASILFTPHWRMPLPIPFPWTKIQPFALTNTQATAISWLCLAIVVTYAFYTMRLLKPVLAREAFDRKRMLALSALFVGLPFLHHGFSRAGIGHIAQGILPLFVLLAVVIDSHGDLWDQALAAVCVGLALLSWAPFEPRINILLRRHAGEPIRSHQIDGRNYYLPAGTADLLTEARRISQACAAGDGEVVAMPYYPGILAYLHVRSPYEELYYLYDRSNEFQQKEISILKAHPPKLVIINPKANIDGRPIASTNPVLYNYLSTHFLPVPVSEPSLRDFVFLTPGCGQPDKPLTNTFRPALK